VYAAAPQISNLSKHNIYVKDSHIPKENSFELIISKYSDY